MRNVSIKCKAIGSKNESVPQSLCLTYLQCQARTENRAACYMIVLCTEYGVKNSTLYVQRFYVVERVYNIAVECCN